MKNLWSKGVYSVLLISILFFIETKASWGKGTRAGITITNWASVEYVMGAISYTQYAYTSTNVYAIYGVSETVGVSNGYIYAGGEVELWFTVTNTGNTNTKLIFTMSNFIMTNGYSGSDWTAYLLNQSGVTIGSVIGTNLQSVKYTQNNVLPDAVIKFGLKVKTTPDANPWDWGKIPLVVFITSQSGIRAKYIGFNGEVYGGTNMNMNYPKVTIYAPYIVLKKTMSISNIPSYLAMGGTTNIPVPDAIITYTNYYDNDGNAKATNLNGTTNLIIVDTLPSHTDFIIGSINITPHNGGTFTVSYYDENYNPYTPSGAVGTPDPNVKYIHFIFTGKAIEPDNGDIYSVADGPFPDADAGIIVYKVLLHRREE